MGEHWVERARRELLARQRPEGGWAYRDGGSPAVEPTALAGLGLFATMTAVPSGSAPAGKADGPAEVRRAAAWLAGQQREDGSVPAEPGSSMPGWGTPHAMLFWSRLGGFDDHDQDVLVAGAYPVRTPGGTDGASEVCR